MIAFSKRFVCLFCCALGVEVLHYDERVESNLVWSPHGCALWHIDEATLRVADDDALRSKRTRRIRECLEAGCLASNAASSSRVSEIMRPPARGRGEGWGKPGQRVTGDAHNVTTVERGELSSTPGGRLTAIEGCTNF